MRILVIEDDKRLSALIQKTLVAEGFQVDAAYTGDEGVEIALRGAHDAAIVDWMLPGRDGPAVCQAIRAARLSMGLLMLTARSQVEDRVAGLNSGADDYLTKPFSFEELIARLHALGRRVEGTAASAFELRVGTLVLDTRAHAARRGNRPLDLTKTEWNLLECFMRHPGQMLSRQYLLDYDRIRSSLHGLNEKLSQLGADAIQIPEGLPSLDLGEIVRQRIEHLRSQGKI